MEVGTGMMRNLRSWSIWCGVGTVEEKHQEISGLTKAEVISMAEECAKCWPRVLVGQKSARHPHGIILGGICYGRKSGKIFEGGAANA